MTKLILWRSHVRVSLVSRVKWDENKNDRFTYKKKKVKICTLWLLIKKKSRNPKCLILKKKFENRDLVINFSNCNMMCYFM